VIWEGLGSLGGGGWDIGAVLDCVGRGGPGIKSVRLMGWAAGGWITRGHHDHDDGGEGNCAQNCIG